MNGAQLFCRILERQGVEDVFAFPGGPLVTLLNALRKSEIRTIVPNSEFSAAFAALGYAAAGERPGILAVIGGPGCSLAINGLMEASSDSVPLVCIVFTRKKFAEKTFQTQETDHIALGAAACKEVIEIRACEDLEVQLIKAIAVSTGGEPGPVMVLLDAGILQVEDVELGPPEESDPGSGEDITDLAQRIHKLLNGPDTTVVFGGRGTVGGARQLRILAERYGFPVITSTSARGVVPENHARSLMTDLVPALLVNQFLEEFDHVIALGVKFSENCSKGFRLDLPTQKLIHIDADPEVLGSNFPARFSAVADVPALLDRLLEMSETRASDRPLRIAGLDAWRERFAAAKSTKYNPVFSGVQPPTAEAFFSGLREILPNNSIVTTDSGFHQMLVRRNLPIHDVHGLLLPANYQSMGYGISTAIGAQLANPDRPVVAIVGDGGLRMCGLEILTAVRYMLPVTFVVFADGFFSEVRNQQTGYDGSSFGTNLPAMDYAAFAQSIGIDLHGNSDDALHAVDESLASNDPSLVIVSLGESASAVLLRSTAALKSTGRHILPKRTLSWLRRLR